MVKQKDNEVMAITDAVLNELLKEYQKPEDLLGKDGLLKQLQKRLLEKAMNAELTVHLGYEKHDGAGDNSGNSRMDWTFMSMRYFFTSFDMSSMTRLAVFLGSWS
jgi:putative transposase